MIQREIKLKRNNIYGINPKNFDVYKMEKRSSKGKEGILKENKKKGK